MKRTILALCALALLSATRAGAQETPVAPPPPAAAAQEMTRVFLDCSLLCDTDYLHREIPFVDWVRDRADADVHLLVVNQRTGGGGAEYTLTFIGQKRFAGVADTLRHATRADASPDDVRSALAAAMKVGLLRYVRGTPAAQRLTVEYHAPEAAAAAAAQQRDPWNHWTFRAGVNGFVNGEKSFRSSYVQTSLGASRVTAGWKLQLSANGSYSENRFDIDSTTSVTSLQRDFNGSLLSVRSVTEHLSLGARGSATRSTFLNYDLYARLAAAVEYDFFPYSESSRRTLSLLYSVGVSSYDFHQRTIFERLHETRLDQSLVASLGLRQKWGSLSFSAEGAHFLDDPSQNRLVLFTSADLHLLRGLSLSFFATGSRVRDQINIQLEGQTPEEILLQQRQRLTGFRYSASMGLSYTFGSIFNNVVNPRFGGSGSGGVIIIN
ncbi:MAG TPA: hypothetical protein VF541_00845 [Longimicrobium sp.]